MQTLSAQDCQPTATFRDDVFVASALFAGQECTMEDLRQILSKEVTAIALTLPHFAAAAAFYRTADPLAPRLILLDEAFVGIDADMRAKCMGLINTFDLDFVMTSEREWGCYQTLPGIAIYQLSTP